jgi:hypothetical protein
MTFINKISLLTVLLLSVACSTQKIDKNRISNIETAHKKADFLKHDVVQFDILLTFGGNERFNAKMTLKTNSTKGHMLLSDSSEIFFDGSAVYYSKNFKHPKRVRFDAFTWAYFFQFPYKLSDEGTQFSEFGTADMNGKTYNTQRLRFAAGIGDAPQDWYFIYADAKTHLIEHAAYIVTAGKTLEEAEADPHAISYADYSEVDGVPFATTWKFVDWNKETGVGKVNGKATISNIRFYESEAEFFTVPEDFIKN